MGSAGPVSNGVQKSWTGMLADHAIDSGRPLRVVCIGGGISGVIAACRFPQQVPNVDFVIYEKNADLGGTWFENRYPGVRCDIPSAGYQFTFESNPEWSEFLAAGPEIQDYILKTAKKYGVYKYCKFQHLFRRARWIASDGKWEIEMKNLLTEETFHDYADILLTATGILNKWDWPKIPGLHDFEGKLMHTASWDEKVDLKDKNVAVIGAGSTGIQILPTIQPVVKHIDHYMKGRNWISPFGLGGGTLAERGVTSGNFKHSPEELEAFAKDPAKYAEFRRKVEEELNAAQLAVFMGTQSQKMFFDMASDSHKQKLADRPDIYDALTPSWVPGCRRLTPGPGYLEACCEPNVDYISTGIEKVNSSGIETVDGEKRPVDIIICATGFDVQRQELDLTGQDGQTLRELWHEFPQAYMSICPPAMPNLFMFLGPNGGPLAGSTIHMLEWVCDYMIKCTKKIQRDFIKSMVVSSEANKAFSDHIDKYFKRTIFAQECASWYKRGQKGDARVVTPWPGSAIHARRAFEQPRWEDFKYERMPEVEENFLAFLGHGMTQAQMDGTPTTDYLDVVLPPNAVEQKAEQQVTVENGDEGADTDVSKKIAFI